MNRSEQERTQIVRTWLDEGSIQISPRVHDAVLREFPRITQDGAFGSWRLRMTAYAAVAVAAVVVIIAIAGTRLLPGTLPGGVPPTAVPSPSEAATRGPGAAQGLPPVGAIPSDPAPGELVLRFEPSAPWMTSWLFADGRLITWRSGHRPADAGDAYIGLVEQRLTPSGVEFLTSEVIATGLFESNLALLREGIGFLNIDVRNGDRLMQLGWGHREWGGAWLTAPTANPMQAEALSALTGLLSSQASWPASVWADQAETAYVPSYYGICVRGVPENVDPDRIWELLPPSAQDLRNGAQPPEQSMGGPSSACTSITTDDARALARILLGAGLARSGSISGEEWVRYEMPDPEVRGNRLWISFGPVLPHGEAVWLGPG